MTIVVYPAQITATPTGLIARFVDFPALEIEGATAAELIGLARERLAGELQRLESDGEAWPEPTSVAALSTPPGASAVLVDVSVDDTPVRLTISIGERLLKRIDEDAAARSMSRSAWLALSARRMLGEAPFFTLRGEAGRKIQDEIEAVGQRLTEALGPESAVGRRLADLDARASEGLRRLGQEVRSAMRPRSPPAGAADAGPAAEAVHPQGAEG